MQRSPQLGGQPSSYEARLLIEVSVLKPTRTKRGQVEYQVDQPTKYPARGIHRNGQAVGPVGLRLGPGGVCLKRLLAPCGRLAGFGQAGVGLQLERLLPHLGLSLFEVTLFMVVCKGTNAGLCPSTEG